MTRDELALDIYARRTALPTRVDDAQAAEHAADAYRLADVFLAEKDRQQPAKAPVPQPVKK